MNFVRWIIWGPVRWVLSLLPYHVALSIGKIVGFVSYFLLSGKRRVLFEEYRIIFPDKGNAAIGRIVRDAFILWSMNEIEYLLHGKIDSNNVQDIINVEGLSLLDESLKRGKGVMLATFHFGCHLQVMPGLGFRGYDISQVANEWTPAINQAAGNPVSRFWAERVYRIRLKHSGSKLPAKVIPVRTGSFPRPLFDFLHKNGVVVIALDGRDVGKLIQIPFLHYKACPFAAGPINLAMRTKAAVHPIFIVREENGRNRIIIEREIALEQKQSREETVAHNTRKVIEVLEAYMLQYPAHYGMELFRTKMSVTS
jgi:KDO2-lipid IV(A) lauroyltransferase